MKIISGKNNNRKPYHASSETNEKEQMLQSILIPKDYMGNNRNPYHASSETDEIDQMLQSKLIPKHSMGTACIDFPCSLLM